MTNLVLVRENPWERMESETDAAFHAFTHYRDIGTGRSIQRAKDDHKEGCEGGERGASISRWEQWSTKYEWHDRTAQFDHHLDRIKVQSYEETAAEVGKRHAEQAAASLVVLSAPAKALARAIEKNGAPLMEKMAELAETDLTAFLALADLVKQASASLPGLAKMEREARGLSTEGGEGEATTVKVVVQLDEGFRL